MNWSSLVLKRLLVIISPGTSIGDLAAYSTYTEIWTEVSLVIWF